MGHIALYREWRPRTFDEVVEQRHTVAALKQAVISGNIAHAYLFSGTRGTGKTTMAQVFSRAINCLHPVNGNPCNQCAVCTGILNGSILDVIEMDAASNNNVDTIRRICDEIVFSPSFAKYKVYIIDEVHMLSAGAFNALLKTLEEPPAHAVFILATTEQHRIPATILSRCQRYEFRRIPIESIVERLRKIADSDGVSISQDALKTVAQMADGALRDAISLLDQAKGSFQKTIEKEDVLSLVGVVNDDFMNQMALSIAQRDPAKAMQLVDRFILDGRDVIRFTMDLATYFRNVMICHVTPHPEELVYAPQKTIEGMKLIVSILPLDSVLELIRQLSALVSDLKWSLNTRTTFEIALIRLMNSPEIIPSGKIAVQTAKSPEAEIPSKQAEIPVKPVETLVTPVEAPVNPMEKPVIPVANEIPVMPVIPVVPVKPAPDPFSELNTLSEPPPVMEDFTQGIDFYPSENGMTSAEPENGIPLSMEHTAPAASSFPEPELSEPVVTLSGKTEMEDFSAETATPSENTQTAPAETIPADIDLNRDWPKIMDNIIAAGQMTVYLFLLPAKPVLKDNALHLLFEDKDQLNCKELSTRPSIQIIAQAVKTVIGGAMDIIPELASEAAKSKAQEKPSPSEKAEETPAEGTGRSGAGKLDLLRKSAEELGITLYTE